jgi:ribonuclease HI
VGTTTSKVAVYTDASTSRNHVGIGIWIPDDGIEVAEGLLKPPELQGARMPINWAELTAVKRALDLFGGRRLCIHTDSKWVLGACVYGWKVTKYRKIADRVRQLLHTTHSHLEWIPREGNGRANDLAQWASGYRDLVIRVVADQ